MSDALKIGTALAGGYLLGRTKKAKAAMGLALWLTGRGRPRDWIRQGVVSLAQTPEFQDLLKQARGPLLESAKGVAGSTLNTRLDTLADDLQRRTASLTDEPEQSEDDRNQRGDDQSGEPHGQAEEEPSEAEDSDASDAQAQDQQQNEENEQNEQKEQNEREEQDGQQTSQKSGEDSGSDRSARGRTNESRKPPARKSA